jgi:hypothetical protein
MRTGLETGALLPEGKFSVYENYLNSYPALSPMVGRE